MPTKITAMFDNPADPVAFEARWADGLVELSERVVSERQLEIPVGSVRTQLNCLLQQPDGIVIHRPGVPVVPIENGIRGKRVTGRDARAFANSAEADRADRKD